MTQAKDLECAWCHRMTDFVVRTDLSPLCVCLPCEDAFLRGQRVGLEVKFVDTFIHDVIKIRLSDQIIVIKVVEISKTDCLYVAPKD